MLQAQNITIGHGGLTFLKDTSFAIDSKAKKRIALLGANGTGKSSLLKVLGGKEEPEKGVIALTREVLGYVPQELVVPEHEALGHYLVSLLEEEWMEYRISIALQEVGLPEETVEKHISQLSGGERVRLSIAIALLEEPTMLLLDEPTNHLDQEGLLWLGKFLTEFAGSFIIITHDRAFINTYLNELWEIDQYKKTIVRYTGNYDDFLTQKETAYQQELKEYNRYQEQIDEAVLWLKENEFHPKFRFSDRVMAKKRILEQLISERPPRPILRKPVKFQKKENMSEQRLLKLTIEEKVLGTRTFLKDQEVIIRVGDRVRILGPNGSGKTTLLRILGKQDTDFKGVYTEGEALRIAYLAQEGTLPANEKMLDYVMNTVAGDQTTLRRMLAHYLFSDHQMDQKIGSLSFGEQKRLELAILLQKKPNLLLLDEPTNHLDIFAREDLEKFLIEEAPTMVIISHDAYFAEKIQYTKEIVLHYGA